MRWTWSCAIMHWITNGPSKRTHDDMPPMNEEVPIGCLVQKISWVASHICSPQSLCPTALQCELPNPEKQGTGCSLRLLAISILRLLGKQKLYIQNRPKFKLVRTPRWAISVREKKKFRQLPTSPKPTAWEWSCSHHAQNLSTEESGSTVLTIIPY